MGDFSFRDKLEEWVEGILDTFETYLTTAFTLNFRWRTAWKVLASEDETQAHKLSRPAIFLILSYFLMCLMILNVDFTDLFFSFNLARLFNAVALVEATQTIKVESIIVNILPAIFLLIFFVYLSKFILWLFSEKEDSRTLRRCYSYMIGNYFILIGIVSAGYEHVVKPLASISWWLGLPIHTITMMPLIGVLVPFNALLQIASLKNGFNLKGYFARTIAYIVPFLLLMLFMKILGGSPYLMNYMKVK